MKRPSSDHQRIWTVKELERLTELLLEHTPIPEIARELGRTEGAVRTRASQIGISLRELNRQRRATKA